MKIEGDYNTADVKIDDLEEACEAQIQEMVNAEAFAGDGDIAIMPDTHWGSGAVIGFTMPVKNKVVPNTIGVDIGCGMFAVNLGTLEFDSLEELDSAVRERVPMGFNVHNRNDFHMRDDFPWNACATKLDDFTEHSDFSGIEANYGLDYFKELCNRIGYDMTRAINSIGTLGGGNHFIEFGRSQETDDVWVIIHSGSRGIGAEIAQYWQDAATNKTTKRKSIDDVPSSVQEYMNDSWKPKADAIREDFDGEDIQEKFDEVAMAIQEYGPSTADRNTDLDYLKSDEAHGYITDMIFAQTYASISRKQMAIAVLDAVRSLEEEPVSEKDAPAWWKDSIESVHNYIDFQDATIRKGACRAHSDERLVVPLNMKYGTLICEGKGVGSWNNSSAHGAGRAMSRTDAKRQFSNEDFAEQTKGVHMSKTPLDEIPGAYKDPEVIEAALGESVEVVDRVVPFLSLKAE